MLLNFIIPLILLFIFEGVALTFNSVVFLKADIEWRKILLIGTISGTTTHVFRLIPMSFGFHTILAFSILSILITKFYKEQLIDSFMAVIKSVILLIILEVICTNLISYITEIKQEVILASPILRTLNSQSHILLMFLIGSLILNSRKAKREEGKQSEL